MDEVVGGAVQPRQHLGRHLQAVHVAHVLVQREVTVNLNGALDRLRIITYHMINYKQYRYKLS
jgi:hypothetical protein